MAIVAVPCQSALIGYCFGNPMVRGEGLFEIRHFCFTSIRKYIVSDCRSLSVVSLQFSAVFCGLPVGFPHTGPQLFC